MLEGAGILLDAWEWLQVYRNVDGEFAITNLADIMSMIKALVPQTMTKYHMTEAIQIAREIPCHEDFSHTNSSQKKDFRRKWNHLRAKTKVLSLEDLQQEPENTTRILQWEPVDLEPAVEDSAVNRATAEQFLGMIDEADAEILRIWYRYFLREEERINPKIDHHSVLKKVVFRI